jgi:FkbM family methyltransferase
VPIEEYWLADAVEKGLGKIARRELAIDVGANRGDWSSELSKGFTKVIAFEPDRRIAVEIPSLPNVEVRNQAVCDSVGSVALYLRPDSGQNSLLSVHPIGAGGQSPAPVVDTIQVACTTLGAVSPDGADFVKIDVEGAEASVLRGCLGSAWARTVFVVECHDTRGEVVEELWRLGKRVRLIRHPSSSAHPGHCWLIGEPA